MPERPRNPRHGGPGAQDEWRLGSLPIGSWVEIYDMRDTLIYRGFVRDQRTTWGYTVVEPVTEGDGNFGGAVESESLYRLYKMSENHRVQAECPVKWLGVDEELAETLRTTELAAAVASSTHIKDQVVLGDALDQSQHTGSISLLPVVSLLVSEEVYDNDNCDRNGGNGSTDGEVQ